MNSMRRSSRLLVLVSTRWQPIIQTRKLSKCTISHATASEELSHRVTKLVPSKNRADPKVKPKIIPDDQLVEEENVPGYDPDEWCTINPGDICNDRYQAIAKIGWGSVSTVWLVRDLKRDVNQGHHGYYTLKISKSGTHHRREAIHEMEVMKRLHDSNPKHKGFKFLRTYSDNFEIQGHSDTHVCLIQEPMRESLGQFRRRFKGDRMPPKMLQGFMQYWLAALDYMHSEAHVVHTDIKDDNILMTFEDESILSEFEAAQATDPMSCKRQQDHVIYQSHASFGPLKKFTVETRLVDFGAAHRMDGVPCKLYPIQPRYYRAPEVILGAGWSYPADIWNLGALTFTLLENHHLFRRVNTLENTYDISSHLAQMYKLLGPLPKRMVERINATCKQKFGPSIPNDAGEECDNPRSYFGGPYFDDNGEFLLPKLIPEDLTWERKVSALAGDDKEMFLRFVRRMLQWDPDERATAGELLHDPWLTQNFVLV